MRARPDALDALLEAWAGWRISYELYEGTGDSAISRFRDPAGQQPCGPRILWYGHIRSQLAQLNSRLMAELDGQTIDRLVLLYGQTGTIARKAQSIDCSTRTLARLRRRARRLAECFLEDAPLVSV